MTIESRVAEARAALSRLGFTEAQTNDRSARVLLGLLQLKPDEPWAAASNPMLGTLAIMNWIRDQYAFEYKPNTRETIRRQTLHQFIEAGLCVYNEDDPARATNSSHNNSKVSNEALMLLSAYGSSEFDARLPAYMRALPGLKTKWAAARDVARIPVTLPGGIEITLGAGGQNVLLKAMVDEFCAIYTPGGEVVYIGDADAKLAHFDESRLSSLGVTVNNHGKLPDLIVYMPDKNWLVLMEAASSHGPVDAKRHNELKAIFAGSSAGLVYVSCFPSRAIMRKYLSDLAWETEAWNSEEPTHLIHLNGSRFLGPYA